MRRKDKKIISILLVLIIFVAQFSSVFATEAPKNLTQYLIENGLDENNDGTLSDSEWAKVKELNIKANCINNLTGIENAVNLKVLRLDSIDISNVDLSKLTKLKELTLDCCDIGNNEVLKLPNIQMLNITGINPNKIDFTKLTKLTSLVISSYGLADASITNLAIPELANIESFTIDGSGFKNIDISKLKNIKSLTISGYISEDEDANIKFPSLESLEYLDIDYPRYWK